MVTQAIPILIAMTLAVLAWTGRISVWEVDVLAAVYGLVQVADTPARQAFTVEMVGRSELPNAVALNSSIFNASRIVGPAIAGVVISWFGVAACFAGNALSYIAVLGCLVAMDPAALHSGRGNRRPPTMLRGVLEGLAYARRTAPVRVILLMMLAVGTISMNFNVIIPVLAGKTLRSGSVTLGILSAGFGLGALGGALFAATLGRASMRLLLLGAAGLGAAELALAWQRTIAGALVGLMVCGVLFTVYTSNSNSRLQLLVPDHLRGRLMALYAWVFFGTAPLGGYLAGRLSEVGGTALAFAVGGAVALLTASGGAWWYRRERPHPGERRDAVADPGAIAAR